MPEFSEDEIEVVENPLTAQNSKNENDSSNHQTNQNSR